MPWIDPKTGEVFNSRPRLDEHGREIPDPTPVAIPSGFRKPETLAETVARLVRHQVSEHAELHGMETFDEADDFDVDEDPQDPGTPFEVFFDPILGRDVTPADFKSREGHYRELYVKRTKAENAQLELEDHIASLRAGRARPSDAGESRRASPEAEPEAKPGKPST